MNGPYLRSWSTGSPQYRSSYSWQKWYRTDKGKRRLPLPYWRRYCTVVKANHAVDSLNHPVAYQAFSQWGRSSKYGSSMHAVHNKAYGRFLDKVRTSVGLGQNLAEYKQTLSLVRSTIDALKHPIITFAQQVRRLGRTGKNRDLTRTYLKDLGGAWLTFHFGVEPLIKDLYAALERLDQQHGGITNRYKASARGIWEYTAVNNGWYTDSVREQYNALVAFQADVEVVNPTLASLNDFGLLNPASIAWEIVPFSFVVDWFYPVGSYLNSFTDLVGYKVTNPSSVWFLSFYGEKTYRQPSGNNTSSVSGYRFERWQEPFSFKIPPFVLPPGMSMTRGATAISLLLQVLQSKHS